ncbi:MAG: hypothetical protein AABX04_03480 [Nanoarchaeota archaeon]
MGEIDLLTELEQLYLLAEAEPEKLLGQIETVRALKVSGSEIPIKFKVLANFVHSRETLQKRGFLDFMLLDEYSLSYSTPQKFGLYRARKIAATFPEEKVVDISCGAGAQLIELCKECSAIGIEKEPIRFWLARINVSLAFHLLHLPFKPQIYNDDALSPLRVLPLISDCEVMLCDSWREAGQYSPELGELHQLYPEKYLVYEFRPLEKAAELLAKYPFLFGKSELEYYGEGDRCSRLTAYIGRGKTVSFFQDDEHLILSLNYSHERAESVLSQIQEKIQTGFPNHDFVILNRCLVEQGFVSLFDFPIFSLDKKRCLVEINIIIKTSRVFVSVLSSTDITEISTYLQENYDNYNVTLRLDIPPEEYWQFAKENNLVTDRQSSNRFSLFKQKNVFLLAEEK